MFNWITHTKHIPPFNGNNTTRVNTKTHKTPADEVKDAWARRRVRLVLMMGKVRRRASAQVRKAHIIDG